MIELTVGYVSGIIAAVIWIIQHYLPTAITLILIGALKEENSAVTWSVVGRTLHCSYWPKLLRADSESSRGVTRSVKWINRLQPLALGLVAIAAVVTPLGLYDDIVPGSTTSTEFQYSQDPSPMGYGTPARSNLGFSRICGAGLPVACPSSDVNITTNVNSSMISASFADGSYDTSIPRNLTEIFQSGTISDKTVSSVFDLEWRSWSTGQDKNLNDGAKYLVGSYRQLDTRVLNNAVEPVEGLISDTVIGGVGFRNHSIPVGLKYGAVWSEDILWVVPETQCVDMNLTLDFTLKDDSTNEPESMVLTDRGGFVNLDRQNPKIDLSDPQQNLNLFDRAYKAAWLNNAYTMVYFNVTSPPPKAFSYVNSKLGRTFKLDTSFSFIRPDTLISTAMWSEFLNIDNSLSLGNFTNATFSDTQNSLYSNPFQISSDNFTYIQEACAGISSSDQGGISKSRNGSIANVAVGCGMVYGAPRKADGSSSLIFEPGSKWTLPLYSCASSSRAVIKTVNFRFNGTEGLRNLEIVNATDKTYSNDAAKPLWAVENTKLDISDAAPLWGIIDSKYAKNPSIGTTRKESLWLPGIFDGFQGTCDPADHFQNLPGVDFFIHALSCAFGITTTSNPVDVADYSGQTSLAMYAKWQQLSRTASTTAQIINLIWTDIATNAVIGTKGWLPSTAGLQKRDGTSPTAQVPVRIYSRRIQYHPLFAIPLLLVSLITFLITITSLALIVLGRANPTAMRRYLTHTSAGRLMTLFIYPDECDPQARTNDWIDRVGGKKINVRGPVPRAADPVMFVANTGHGKPEDTLLVKPGVSASVTPMGGVYPAGGFNGSYEMQPRTPGVYNDIDNGNGNGSGFIGHAQ